MMSAVFAETIVRQSSFQTYITVKLLVDRPLQADCFKAYAYFRWLDDQVDIVAKTKPERLRIIANQQRVINACYAKQKLTTVHPHEQLIVDLIHTDGNKNSKLGSFIQNFFAIIAFDARRKDRAITESELTWYTHTLAKAVTDGIEHFINHDRTYPDSPHHYAAAIGAHLTHMLRDYQEDITEGYINIPAEYLRSHRLKPTDVTTPVFKQWVKLQVAQAQECFTTGKHYILSLPFLRGKLAAAWYCCRFEHLLTEIADQNYDLTTLRPNRHHLTQYLRMLTTTLKVLVRPNT